MQNITVSQSHGKWFVRTQTERAAELPIPQGGVVGINIGIARSVTLSDGTSYAPLGSFRQQHADCLRRAQPVVSRNRVLGATFGDNRKKARACVGRIQASRHEHPPHLSA